MKAEQENIKAGEGIPDIVREPDTAEYLKFSATQEARDLQKQIFDVAYEAADYVKARKNYYRKILQQGFQDVPAFVLITERPEEFRELVAAKKGFTVYPLNSTEIQEIYEGCQVIYPDDPEEIVFIFSCRYKEWYLKQMFYI
jgi:hypothetical protein